MPNFSVLPTEIVQEIFSSLDPTDLARTSLVSHRIHSISSSLLYRNVSLSAATIQPFIRTLLAREDLAHHVKHLRCSFRWNGAHPLHAMQVSLLLHLIPTLQILDCTPAELLINNLPSAPLPAALQSVREFRNRPHSEDSIGPVISAEILLATMLLPCIRRVEAHTAGLYPPDNFDALYTAHAGTSPVTDLVLADSYITPQTLQRVLALPSALTRLFYEYSRPMMAADVAAIGAAIGPLRATLQSLHISVGDVKTKTDQGATYTIGSLRAWPCLTRVGVPLLLLLGMPRAVRLGDVLPGGIEHLAIEKDFVWGEVQVADAVFDLLRCRGRVGRLESVSVAEWLMWDRELSGRLEEACNEVGVAFELVGDD